MQLDPYAPPQAPIADPTRDAGRPAYKLASAGHVALATFLGSPFAGALVMANNFRLVGKKGAALLTAAAGVLGSGALFAVAFALPNGAPGVALPMVSVAVMFGVARMTQGELLHRHRESGGQESSAWLAGGIGGASLVVVLAVIFGVAFAVPASSVKYGPEQEVVYEEGANEAEARAVGDSLKEQGYFPASGAATVRLTKNGDVYELGFVVQEGSWNDAENVATFREVGKNVRERALPGKRLRVLLLNEWMMTKKTLEI